jgi:hypothetical protein
VINNITWSISRAAKRIAGACDVIIFFLNENAIIIRVDLTSNPISETYPIDLFSNYFTTEVLAWEPLFHVT